MMHDIWNPWHGCTKVSEGCQNCYMFRQDRLRGRDGSVIYKTKSDFDAPLKRDRLGNYKVKSGEMIRVCMNSDFFLEEADSWRDEAWDIMRIRSDVIFFLLTKRPERVKDCLPEDFGDGWDHIFLNVTCENQRRADERIPILLSLPFRHKGIMCAPYSVLFQSKNICLKDRLNRCFATEKMMKMPDHVGFNGFSRFGKNACVTKYPLP